MFVSKEAYGTVRMNSCVPSAKAVKYLNSFHSLGWHECNTLYHQKYKDGIGGSLVIFTVGGKGVLKIKDKSFILTGGTVAVVPPKTSMEYYTHENSSWEFYWINIYGTGAELLVKLLNEENNGLVLAKHIPGAEKIIRELMHPDYANKLSFEIEASLKIQELLHLILKKIHTAGENSTKKDTVAINIVSYIEENYQNRITLSMLSRTFYISENQLIRNVTKETGFTPYEYLKRYRLMKSCELLQLTDKPIEEISKAVGFSNVSNYIYQFKLLYDITPLKYRKRFSPML